VNPGRGAVILDGAAKAAGIFLMPIRSAHRRRGFAFTLIELLVVVTIIVLLLAMLLPAMGLAISKAQVGVCASNLRQLHVAIMGYAADNGNVFFPFDGLDYMGYVEPYHDKVDTLRMCPAATTLSPHQLWAPNYNYGDGTTAWIFGVKSAPPTPPPQITGSIGFNGFCYNPNGASNPGGRDFFTGSPEALSWPSPWFGSVGGVRRPAISPIFEDEAWVDGWPTDADVTPSDFTANLGLGTYPYQMARYFIDRHNKAINLVMYDGHVDLKSVGALWTLTWNNVFVTKGLVPVP
jgi:prepilin-type processing-associated H-X9-DG protein